MSFRQSYFSGYMKTHTWFCYKPMQQLFLVATFSIWPILSRLNVEHATRLVGLHTITSIPATISFLVLAKKQIAER